MGLTINATYDTSITSSPLATQIEGAIQAAIQFFQSAIGNNITVNIDFGYGEVDGGAISTGNVAQSKTTNGFNVNYTTLIGALTSSSASNVDAVGYGTLSPTDPTPGGNGTFYMTNAEAKATGLLAANNAAIDGYVGLSSAYTYTFDPNNRAVAGEHDAIGAFEHEISEIMGRYGALGQSSWSGRYTAMDLFRSSASGTRSLTPGPGYFSIDNVNLLKQYNNPLNGGDADDWLPSIQGNSFGSNYTGVASVVTRVDLQEMDLIGYTLALPTDTAAQLIAAYNAAPTIAYASISDSATTISADLNALEALATPSVGAISAITLTNPTTPVAVSLAQLTADADVLNLIADPFDLQIGNGTSSFSYTVANNVGAVTVTGSGAATLTANAVSEAITGGSGNDVIYGGTAATSLNGGAGDDTFYAGSGGGTINGGGGDDQVYFGVASSAVTITQNADGSWAVTNGTFLDTLSNVEVAHFTDTNVALRELDRTDITGSGTSGMILQSGGTVVDWTFANGAYQSGNVLTTGATGYTVGGSGDFNGDGTADVVLQNGGTVVDWILSNGAYQSGNVITTGATGYTVKGTGDFNGDGTSDIVLQNGGIVVDWIMKNGAYQSGNVLTTGAAGYTVVGTGDFNGDGTTDVLLQNGGTVVDWIMKNGQYQSGNVITTGAAGYTVVGTGDFNGDGTTDIVLQNASGTVIDWIMKNGVYQSGNVITTGAAGYTVVGTGDYNGDGTADIALQNGGTVVDWIMHNGVYQSGSVITTGATGFNVKA